MPGLVTIVETPVYLARAERLMSEAERALIVDQVAGDPAAGAVIRGTFGLRKLRVALSGRGKRGGARLIYWFHSNRYPAVLLWVFAKNEAEDLTHDQRARLVALSRLLMDDFGD